MLKLLLVVFSFLFLVVFLTLASLHKYNYNTTAFVYAWEGFYLLNLSFFPKGFVIHTQGGYDGQFFYLIARSLFSELGSPILDAFELRFRRIGLSILGGVLGFIFGWENYSISTFIILWILHLLSCVALYKLLKQSKQQYLCLFYLFSPFSWSSNFLLVSDSLFSSFLIFSIYLLKKLGFSFYKPNFQNKASFVLYISSFFVIVFFLLIRETGLLFLISFLFLSFVNKQKYITIVLGISLFSYLGFWMYVRFFHEHLLGTNPLKFIQLIDFPFFGFVKSILHINLTWKESFKLFILFLLIGLTFLHFSFIELKLRSFLTVLPLLLYSILIIIAEEGYFNNYDNLSRFFTPCIPYVSLVVRKANLTKKVYFGVTSFLFFVFLFKKILQSFQPALYFLV